MRTLWWEYNPLIWGHILRTVSYICPIARNLWWRDTCHVGTLSLAYWGVPWRVILKIQFWLTTRFWDNIVQLKFFGPMNSLKYKVFWWIWFPMGSLKRSIRVVLMITLGKNIYMQISAAIIENRIFINNFFVMNSKVSKMVSTPIFSWSRITMNIFIEF